MEDVDNPIEYMETGIWDPEGILAYHVALSAPITIESKEGTINVHTFFDYHRPTKEDSQLNFRRTEIDYKNWTIRARFMDDGLSEVGVLHDGRRKSSMDAGSRYPLILKDQ